MKREVSGCKEKVKKEADSIPPEYAIRQLTHL